MNEFIRILPGKLLKADGSQTNILEALGIEIDPMTVRNDGYKRPEIAAIVIGENQYALADILEAIGEKIGNVIPTKITVPQDGDTLVYVADDEAWENTAAENAE